MIAAFFVLEHTRLYEILVENEKEARFENEVASYWEVGKSTYFQGKVLSDLIVMGRVNGEVFRRWAIHVIQRETQTMFVEVFVGHLDC